MSKQNTYRFWGVAAILLFPAFLNAYDRMKNAWYSIVPMPAIRNDDAGLGHYGAPRNGHVHNGVDILVVPGNTVRSPIDGMVTRVAYPYANDFNWKGVEIQGTGNWENYKVKMFYLTPDIALIGQPVIRGQAIGVAQKISDRYPGQNMQDHVHVEVFKNGVHIDPTNFLVA